MIENGPLTKKKLQEQMASEGLEHGPPETVRGCPYYTRRPVSNDPSRWCYWPCGNCKGCEMYAFDVQVGQCLAEAQSSAIVLAVTLTYRDGEDGAIWLNSQHVSDMVRRLRRRGFSVRKFTAGEYGGKQGRAHWHLLLFFQYSEEMREQWIEDFAAGVSTGEAERSEAAFGRCPPLRWGLVPREDFKAVLADPETLYCSTPAYKTTASYANQWAFWPHGIVTAEIVKAPGFEDPQAVNKAVRYVMKYFHKADPWRDSRQWKSRAFDDLPEHVKQGTKYHKDEAGKFVRGNPYVEKIKEAALAYPSDDAVPLDERPKIPRFDKGARPVRGAFYFRALGLRWAAENDALVKPSFTIPGVMRRKPRSQALRELARSGVTDRVGDRHTKFPMSGCAFLEMAKGFNLGRERLGKETVTGRRHVWDDLETKAAKAGDRASGEMGFHLWNKATPGQRRTLEQRWADIPNERLRGLVPRRFIRHFEEFSRCEGWKNKRRDRLRLEREGRVKALWPIADGADVSLTDRGKWMFQRDLKPGVEWWRRELVTVEDLQRACAGKLLPPGAKSERKFQEGRGDVSPLASFDVRTVRRWLDEYHDHGREPGPRVARV